MEKPILPSVMVAAGLLLGSASADAASLKQHLYCGVIQIQLPTVIVTPPPVATLTIRNTTSGTIAPGTSYTYVVNGHTNSFQSSSALTAGDHISFQIGYDASLPGAYDCDAWVPRLIARIPTANIKTLKAQ